MKIFTSLSMKVFMIIFVISLSSLAFAQNQTVGLFINDNNSFNGYTLFNPINSNTTYLIDNCGRVVNTWISSYNPALSVYLLENGNLLRTCKVPYPDLGGRLEILDWEGQIVWSYDFSSDNFYLHHDIEPLPNGNILVVSTDIFTPAEAIAAGRDPSTLENEFWAEKIIEVEPVGSNSINIVWEWRAWDHLVQEFTEEVNNFGIVSEHPELLDINYSVSGGPNANIDWMHINSVAYNTELDQILISSRNMSEVFIIDHSTTISEAASHSGGIYGKGGDLLYRFGNPETYNRGGPNDRLLFFQHNATWVPDGARDEKKIIVFNNQYQVNASAVNVFDPPQDSPGVYSVPSEGGFGPEEFDWSYASGELYSPKISGAQRLPNGNTLICTGISGSLTEVDTDGNIVWLYVNPTGKNGPVNQGVLPNLNDVFKVIRYSPDYAGLAGQPLVPGDPIELNPWTNDCDIMEDTIAAVNLKVFLEGPFSNPAMTTTINEAGYLPLSQPFHVTPWDYQGTESVPNIPNNSVVDWVLVDFRDAEMASAATASAIIFRQAAFLLADGSIVDVDGSSLLKFYNSFKQNIFVSVWHRNHLGVISSSPVSKENNHLVYDFTTGEDKVLGGSIGYKKLNANRWGMISGDGLPDGIINNLDYETGWKNETGSNGYLNSDFNFDGTVDNKDKNDDWFINQYKNSQVPE